MKDIKDYIHLYIGCEVFGTYNDNSGSKGILTGVTNGCYECEIQFFLEDGINVEEEPEWNETKEVKPILRRLSSMTEEEAKNVISLSDNMRVGDKYKIYDIQDVHIAWTFRNNSITRYVIFNKLSPKQFIHLLSKGFDLFGLIDYNLAIDSSTITENKQ